MAKGAFLQVSAEMRHDWSERLRELSNELQAMSEKFKKKSIRRLKRAGAHELLVYADSVFADVPAYEGSPGVMRQCAVCKITFGKTSEEFEECCPVCEFKCIHCGKPSQGNYSIERDGPFNGPLVPLCDACGMDDEPTMEEIWEKISEQEPPA